MIIPHTSLPNAPDSRLRDPGTLELIFHKALQERDWRVVQAALDLVAVVDPQRCLELIDLTKIALEVTRSDRD